MIGWSNKGDDNGDDDVGETDGDGMVKMNNDDGGEDDRMVQ